MYNHAPDDYACPFCLLVRTGEDESPQARRGDIIFQDDLITAFISLGQYPNNPGNVLIAPNQHFENIYDLPSHLAARIAVAAQAVARAMKAAFACDGVSTRQHNEPAGSQDVWHYHLHVTPRYTSDNFYATRHIKMPAPERKELAQRLRDALALIND